MNYKEAWDIMKLRLMEEVERRNQFNRACIAAGLHDAADMDAQKIQTLLCVIDDMHKIEHIIKFENKYKGVV